MKTYKIEIRGEGRYVRIVRNFPFFMSAVAHGEGIRRRGESLSTTEVESTRLVDLYDPAQAILALYRWELVAAGCMLLIMLLAAVVPELL